MLVRDLMTKDVITVSPDTSLRRVGELLRDKKISGLPVLNNSGELVGIITLTDMFRFIIDNIYQVQMVQKEHEVVKFSDFFDQQKLQTKVEDIMSRKVFTIKEDDSLDVVMKFMFEQGVHTLPVVKDGKLIGVIGKRDLAFAAF